MSKTYIEEKTFDKIDFSKTLLVKGDYENCTFINCTLSGSDLSNINFSECIFKGCDLSMAKITNTALREVIFNDCKLLGLHFENCNEFLFAVCFETCFLHLASFYKLKIKKTVFKNCNLQETDFTECDLSNSVFDNCDLANAIFDGTLLEKADLRTAYNYSINPETNRIKKARFSTANIAGLLDKYDIEIE